MKCSRRKIGGREFQLNHASALERQAEWVLSYFERMQKEGMTFFSGMKIQFGWSFLELRENGENIYLIQEPDFSGNPFSSFRADVSTTLQVQASQNNLIEELDIAPSGVSFQDKIVFAKGSLEAERVYIERIPPQPEKNDSGWFLGLVEGNNQPENLQAMWVYQLLQSRPILLQFLLLPPGYMVIVKGSSVEEILDAAGNSRMLDSYRGT